MMQDFSHRVITIMWFPTTKGDEAGVANLRFCDGLQGVVSGSCTCFPVTMGRGATFDTDL